MLLRRAAIWLVLILIVSVTIEGAATVAVYWLVFSQRGHFLIWNPDIEQVRDSWESDSKQIDEELGWPSFSHVFVSPWDRTGAKENADFPVGTRPCASVYGPSFVWGDGVALMDGWVEQLGRQLGCRVSNFGVSGYGTDQAFLRFRRTVADDANIVLLGIHPENIIRNVNQFRGFLGMGMEPGFLKGRFVLGRDGGLEWLPRPVVAADRVDELLSSPEKVIPHEYFLPDTADGPVSLRFPMTLTIARVALMPRVRTRLTGNPSWAEFYDPRHPSGALQITAGIAEAFAREAARRGKSAIVVMLPGASSFRRHEKFGTYEYSTLVADLVSRGVEVFDPAPAMLAAVAESGYCSLYVDPTACEGHFGVLGGKVFASVVAAELDRRKLVKR